MRANQSKLAFVVHILTAFVLLLKGLDKIINDHLGSGITLFFLGTLVLVLTLFEKKLGLSHFSTRQACLLIESLALFIMAYVFVQEGRQYLQYAFGASALTYLIIAIVNFIKPKKAVH